MIRVVSLLMVLVCYNKSPISVGIKKIGYLEQSNTILAVSLCYNLTVGITEVDEERVWEVLKQLELAKWANGLPEGFNTWLGESGNQLSGGQGAMEQRYFR